LPLKIQKAWLRWCLNEHPDKGGENDAYMEMKQECNDFKEWFPERFEQETWENVKQKMRAADIE